MAVVMRTEMDDGEAQLVREFCTRNRCSVKALIRQLLIWRCTLKPGESAPAPQPKPKPVPLPPELAEILAECQTT